MISARIPYILPGREGHEETDVPTFWLLSAMNPELPGP